MSPRTLRRVAVTGGTGFLGGALIDLLLREGVSVAALARTPAKLDRFSGRIDVVQGDLADEDALRRLADDADAFVHAAALTHALTKRDFDAANVEGAANAARAAFGARARFIFISSIAARRPDLSDYAASKAGGEAAVTTIAGAHEKRFGAEITEVSPAQWVILRAPALYGPYDEATLPYFKMAKIGLAPEPAATPAPRASILFVEDMARAILTAAREAPDGVIYDVGDTEPQGHSWAEIGRALGAAFDKRPLRIPAPRPILTAQAAIAEVIARVRGRATIVTRGKIREFFHPDWVAGEPALGGATSWRATTPLAEGFAKTLKWYQERGLI
ncbi:MAG: SDR family NAD(P)-dependent oxidoreductase [Pseudomonadota bacterium]